MGKIRSSTYILIVLVPIVGAFFALLPTFHWLLEVNRAFTLYRFALALVGVVWLFVLRKSFSKGVYLLSQAALVLLYLPCALTLYDFHKPQEVPQIPTSAQMVKVLYANVYSRNEQYQKLRAIIDRESPDIVGLLEYTHLWDRNLDLSAVYPYKISYPEDHDFGLALFSRYPIEVHPDADAGEDLPRVIWADVKLPDQVKFGLTLLHAFPPVDKERFLGRRRLLKRVSTRLKHESGSQLLVADLNSTPFSFTYQFFTADEMFTNAMNGFGLFATWQAGFLRLSLDHLLYRGNFVPVSFKRLEDFGSDHFPLLAEFRVW